MWTSKWGNVISSVIKVEKHQLNSDKNIMKLQQCLILLINNQIQNNNNFDPVLSRRVAIHFGEIRANKKFKKCSTIDLQNLCNIALKALMTEGIIKDFKVSKTYIKLYC